MFFLNMVNGNKDYVEVYIMREMWGFSHFSPPHVLQTYCIYFVGHDFRVVRRDRKSVV